MSCEVGFSSIIPSFSRSLSADVTAPVDPSVNTSPPRTESPLATDPVAVAREPSPLILSTSDSRSTDADRFRERAAELAASTAAASESAPAPAAVVRASPFSLGNNASGAAARAGVSSSAAFDPSRFNPAELTYVVRKPPDANSIASSIAAGATPTYTSEFYRFYRHPPSQAPHGPGNPTAHPNPSGDQSASANVPVAASNFSASSSTAQGPSQTFQAPAQASPHATSSNAGGSVIATYTAIHKLTGIEYLAKVCCFP